MRGFARITVLAVVLLVGPVASSFAKPSRAESHQQRMDKLTSEMLGTHKRIGAVFEGFNRKTLVLGGASGEMTKSLIRELQPLFRRLLSLERDSQKLWLEQPSPDSLNQVLQCSDYLSGAIFSWTSVLNSSPDLQKVVDSYVARGDGWTDKFPFPQTIDFTALEKADLGLAKDHVLHNPAFYDRYLKISAANVEDMTSMNKAMQSSTERQKRDAQTLSSEALASKYARPSAYAALAQSLRQVARHSLANGQRAFDLWVDNCDPRTCVALVQSRTMTTFLMSLVAKYKFGEDETRGVFLEDVDNLNSADIALGHRFVSTQESESQPAPTDAD